MPLPASAQPHELFGAAIVAGLHGLGHSPLIKVFEELAGVEVKRP